MRCEKCRKKGIHINCNHCKGNYCSSCIQLEIHKCKGIQSKIDKDLAVLEKTLEFVKEKQITI